MKCKTLEQVIVCNMQAHLDNTIIGNHYCDLSKERIKIMFVPENPFKQGIWQPAPVGEMPAGAKEVFCKFIATIPLATPIKPII